MLLINLVYNRDNDGVRAQLFSKHEVAQSANAIRLRFRNTIDDLAFVDMLFNPNFDDTFNFESSRKRRWLRSGTGIGSHGLRQVLPDKKSKKMTMWREAGGLLAFTVFSSLVRM